VLESVRQNSSSNIHIIGYVVPDTPIPEKITIQNPVLIGEPDKATFDSPKRLNQLRELIQSYSWKTAIMNSEERRIYLEKNGKKCLSNANDNRNIVLDLYESLVSFPHQDHLAEELWKYCALAVELEFSNYNVAAYVHVGSEILVKLGDFFDSSQNYAVLGDEKYYPNTIHSSLIVVQKSKLHVMKDMVKDMVEMGVDRLRLEPLYLARKLHSITCGKNGTKDWNLLKQRCHAHDKIWNNNAFLPSHIGICPPSQGYCCDLIISQSEIERTVAITKHILLPHQYVEMSEHEHNPEIDIKQQNKRQYVTGITDVTSNIKPNNAENQNFFDLLLLKDCLPRGSKGCRECMKDFKRGTCEKCGKECGCFCDHLCNTPLVEKAISKTFHAKKPIYRVEPNRLIPRRVHQTYFVEPTSSEFPNMSRLVESWRQSGWDHKFYNDTEARAFLLEHFPDEVVEAFDEIIPGAYKADLFRYCVLFIEGGVYADTDVLLETNLDAAVEDDVGFMIPYDEVSIAVIQIFCLLLKILISQFNCTFICKPGTKTRKRMCLWNGFIASAPGHPFLAKAIETVVNNVRNKFTSLDVMNTLCPNPDFTVSNSYDVLFITGPCLLGWSVNMVLGRDPQDQFEHGNLTAKESNQGIPGKSIILMQRKNDMGSQRFTYFEKNLLIASTDLQDSEEPEIKEDEVDTDQNSYLSRSHYSNTRKKGNIYGLTGLYKSGIDKKANENIQIRIE